MPFQRGQPRAPLYQCMRFVLLFLFAGMSGIAALDPAKTLNAYVRRTWTVDNGLPQNSINAMVQSSDGYMWFATENGLARFDGSTFTIFDKQNTHGLLSNQITSLLVDKENVLWIGTRGGGISSYRNGEFQAFLSQNGVTGNSVRCLNADSKGNIWIGTDNSGLVRFTSGVFQTYTSASGLLDNSILALASDDKGTLWIATASGLNVMDKGKLTAVIRNSSDNQNFIRTMYLDRRHTLWLGTNGDGLLAWQPGQPTYSTTYSTKQGLSDSVVTSIYQDAADTLWVGTLGGGLNRIVSGRVQSASFSSASSRGNTISNITEDREGGLWIGTATRGMMCLRNGAVTTLSQGSILPSDTVLPVFEDSQQSIWVGTNHGLTRMRKNGVDHFTEHDGLPDELISSIAQDGAGNMWVGTRHGLARYNGKKFVAFGEQPGMEAGFVHCLVADRNGDIWIGSRSGLTHYDGGRFVTYTTQDGLPDNHVLAIHQSRDGAIWFGTDGGGLGVFKEGKFTSYTSHDGLPDDVVLAISEDTDGSLFLGTSGAGFVHFVNGRFTAYGTAQGLPDDTVYQVIDDLDGSLWLSSTKGIFSVLKSGLNATVIDYRLFGTGDGMLTRECNGGFQPAGARTHDGRIWIPTAAGLSVIKPSELYENVTPLQVNIERVEVNGKWRPAAAGISLAPGETSLAFEFAAPSFAFNNHQLFRYWLKGVDENWSAPTTAQTARYSHLGSGDYQFQVASSRDGVTWLSESQPLDITLQPQYYQTAQFYMGVCSALIAIFYFGHLRKVRGLRKQLRLAAPAQIIEEEQRNAPADLLRLNASLAEAAQVILAPTADEEPEKLDVVSFSLPLLAREVAEITTLRAEARGLNLRIDGFPKNIHHVSGDPEKLKRILLNLLDNAIEFTPRGTIHLRIGTGVGAQAQSIIQFSVTDMGMGLLPPEFKRALQMNEEPVHATPATFQGSARRLFTAIQLTRLMGGELWVESRPGMGNTFHFTAQLGFSLTAKTMLLEASPM